MALDDTFKALQMFGNGMQQLAVSSGINAAQQQVQDINNSMQDEMQKRMQRQQAANQLALRLVGAGANGQQVAQASQALAGPQANSAAELFQQGLATGDKSMMAAAKQAQSFENDPKMQQIGATGDNEANVANIKGQTERDVAMIKLGKEQKQSMMKSANQFNVATKDLRGQLDTLDGMQGLTDSKNPISDAALRTQLPRVLGDMKGRIPFQEIQMFGGSQALIDKLQRAMATGFKGVQFTDKDRAEITSSLALAKESKEKALANNMQLYAGQGLQTGAYNSMEHGLATLAGNDPRLKRLSGLDQAASPMAPAAPGAAPAGPQQQQQPRIEARMNVKTNRIEKVYVDANGNPIGLAQ